jgi:hypothetical protein
MSTLKLNNRRDFLLLLLYSPGTTETVNEPVTGRTRLVKMLFVFKEEALSKFKSGAEITEENFYRFFPWDFGPFSSDVYDDLSFFQLRGFIDSSSSPDEPIPESAEEWEHWQQSLANDGPSEEYEEEVFRLTERGIAFSAPYFETLTSQQKRTLKLFKTRFIVSPLRAILRYVYETYPAYTTKSTIKDKVLGNAP